MREQTVRTGLFLLAIALLLLAIGYTLRAFWPGMGSTLVLFAGFTFAAITFIYWFNYLLKQIRKK